MTENSYKLNPTNLSDEEQLRLEKIKKCRHRKTARKDDQMCVSCKTSCCFRCDPEFIKARCVGQLHEHMDSAGVCVFCTSPPINGGCCSDDENAEDHVHCDRCLDFTVERKKAKICEEIADLLNQKEK